MVVVQVKRCSTEEECNKFLKSIPSSAVREVKVVEATRGLSPGLKYIVIYQDDRQ
jgi:hypothetical protein